MAAGVTDHRWSMHELMHYAVPPPPFVPPKRYRPKYKRRKDVPDETPDPPDHSALTADVSASQAGIGAQSTEHG